MRILAFCFFPAFTPPSNGGQSRLSNFYRSLSKLHEVVLLTSTHFGVKDETILHNTGFIERRIAKDNYFLQEYALLEQYSSGGDLSGPATAACGGFPTRLHQAYLEEYEKADAIIHDFPFTSAYDIFAGIDNKPRIYNAHNCEYKLYKELHSLDDSFPIHNIVKQAEVHMLEIADLVLYCNEKDLKYFHDLAPKAGFSDLYTPNGMTPLAVDPMLIFKPPQRFTAIFMGSGHPPNIKAAKFIIQELALGLPDVDFKIIGDCLPEGNYSHNVRSYGVVSDEVKKQIMTASDIALNPMSEGSGSNVKVLDYFAHRLAVLSSSFGMRGIQAVAGIEYLDSSLDKFGETLNSVREKPELLNTIAQNGQALAVNQYTWDAIAIKVADALEELVESKKTTSNEYVLVLNDYDSFSGVGGGNTRTQGLYEVVSKWSSVILVCFSSSGQLKITKPRENIFVINVPKTSAHLEDLQRVNACHHVSADDIVSSRHCTTNPYLTAVYRVLRQYARCIVVEHCYLVPLPALWRDRFLYSSQNDETRLKQRLLESHPLRGELLLDVQKLERFAVESSALTVAVSNEDARTLVKNKRASGPVLVVRNGAAAPLEGEQVEKLQLEISNSISEHAVVFLGSGHMPNAEAAQFIIKDLAAKHPEVQFHILGSVCDSVTKVPGNVKLWGVVDDKMKSAIMQSCALAINPMLSGSGSNVKLADYIGNGLYVVTTEFGWRGYPPAVKKHLSLVGINEFSAAVDWALKQKKLQSVQARQERKELFERELSMQKLAESFVKILQNLEVKKKRILYVAYRYVDPALGGAEVNIEKFVRALGYSNKFDVDVIAPEISGIHNYWRFSERYSFDSSLGVPVDIPNVRFAHFPVDKPTEMEEFSNLRTVWQAQPRFEQAVSKQLMSDYTDSGLGWGWSYPEGEGESTSRWAFAECGIFLKEQGTIEINGFAADEIVVTAYKGGMICGGPWVVKKSFNLELLNLQGEIVFITSASLNPDDPRPLGFHVSKVKFNGVKLNLAAPMLFQAYLSSLPAGLAFQVLDQAAELSRVPKKLELNIGRGPWSVAMESYIANHIKEYDLVISHNNVFRPAVVAMAEAKKQGVPSILIPHAHLDDDYYHFPDWLQSARDASLVLAVPKTACDFLAEKGCNVQYLSAGCDVDEEFTEKDIEAFRAVYSNENPFILILGRKAGAKGYRAIIDAIDQLNADGHGVSAVLIGPDDDGLPVTSSNAICLGGQPRSIVRGALQTCLALCNMSSSESFGIVLLEAWLAGKPVIANVNCAAFHEMAVNNENSLLVQPGQVKSAIEKLLSQPELSQKLSEKGKAQLDKFSWNGVADKFVDICFQIVNASKHQDELIK